MLNSSIALGCIMYIASTLLSSVVSNSVAGGHLLSFVSLCDRSKIGLPCYKQEPQPTPSKWNTVSSYDIIVQIVWSWELEFALVEGASLSVWGTWACKCNHRMQGHSSSCTRCNRTAGRPRYAHFPLLSFEVCHFPPLLCRECGRNRREGTGFLGYRMAGSCRGW